MENSFTLLPPPFGAIPCSTANSLPLLTRTAPLDALGPLVDEKPLPLSTKSFPTVAFPKFPDSLKSQCPTKSSINVFSVISCENIIPAKIKSVKTNFIFINKISNK